MVSLDNRSPSYIPLQVHQLLFVRLMENNRVAHFSLKGRNDDPLFSPVKDTDQSIDCSCFEKRLVSQSNQNAITPRAGCPKPLPDRTAHALPRMGIHQDPHFSPLEEIFNSFVSAAQD